MTDAQIKEAARLLDLIAYHQREIHELDRRSAGHENEIAKARAAIEALRAGKAPSP